MTVMRRENLNVWLNKYPHLSPNGTDLAAALEIVSFLCLRTRFVRYRII